MSKFFQGFQNFVAKNPISAFIINFITNPISSDANNSATLGTDNKIYVPTVAPGGAQDYKVLSTTSSQIVISNTSVETIYTSLPILPADNLVGAIYELHANISKGPAGHVSTLRIYINTSPTIGGTKVLEAGTGFNANSSFSFFYRYFKNSVGLVVPRDVNAGLSVWANIQTNSLVSTTPITFTNTNTYYVILTTQMSGITSSETLQFAKLCLIK
jgi:hypothetical protein